MRSSSELAPAAATAAARRAKRQGAHPATVLRPAAHHNQQHTLRPYRGARQHARVCDASHTGQERARAAWAGDSPRCLVKQVKALLDMEQNKQPTYTICGRAAFES